MNKLTFNFKEIDKKTQSKLVQGTVIPRPIAWIETKNSDGSINLAPFSYFNVFSPTIVGVSFQSKKDTCNNILREKTARIHSVSQSMLETMDNTAMNLAVNESEVEKFKIDLSSISKIHMDVEYYSETVLPGGEILILLQVVSVSVDESVYDQNKGYIDATQLDPVARLAGPNYARIEQLNYKRKY